MPKLIKVINREQCIGCLSCMFACARTWQHALTPDKSCITVRRYPGTTGAFSIRVCYGCKDPDCAYACPTKALKPRNGGGVVFEPDKCIHCDDSPCVEACVSRSLPWDYEKKMPLVCTHCGVCANFCPNDVLALVEV